MARETVHEEPHHHGWIVLLLLLVVAWLVGMLLIGL
jgi:hypothetical protein